ncbi:MAG TPA: cytochrome C oxidase subunit IV family protein [Vicinamibacterales bacterium]|nr:cytochrome C oxidase subunit IV family protein [Vicinamibacterales bacterium]
MSHIAPKSMYYTIFGILMVMTALTVFAAFQHLGVFNFPVAIGIAITKATLVVLFFMHAKYSSRLTKLFVGMSFFFLVIMFALTLTDYMSRGLKTYPGGAGGAGYGVRSAAPAHEAPASGAHKEGAAETAH